MLAIVPTRHARCRLLPLCARVARPSTFTHRHRLLCTPSTPVQRSASDGQQLRSEESDLLATLLRLTEQTSLLRKDHKRKKATSGSKRAVVQSLHPNALVHKVKQAAERFVSDGEKRTQILRWGISGRELELASNHILGITDSLSDEDRIASLLLQWWDEAKETLSRAIMQNTKTDHWDGRLLRSMPFECIAEELPRQFVASFLAWMGRGLQNASGTKYLSAHLRSLLKVADLRYPSLENISARTLTRNIHLHVGPTNSGKTHGALVALCKARTGIYAGPLRLLAHEVWDRINSGTVSPGLPPRPCNLLTGEEQRVVDPVAGLQACTVEMVPPDRIYDVAVIDEIQMIGDPDRGFAWTSAVLGLAAKEVHLCGESSVVPLIRRMAEACGDNVHVHEYNRLTPLSVGESLESLSNIRKGDCIVAFSRSAIFQLKGTIESTTGLKCAVAYGALPPETKSEQAKLFNDPTNDIDVMVASDAIGMGLNLKIKRIIFSEVTKWNGSKVIPVSFSQIKQIAGRAGRYGTGDSDEEVGGIVTTYKAADLDILRQALEAPLKPITHAAIQGGSERLEELASLLPAIADTTKRSSSRQADKEDEEYARPRSLRQLFRDASLLTRVDTSTYFASSLEQQDKLAPVIEGCLPSRANLTLGERETFANSPTNVRDERLLALLQSMLRLYAQGKLVTFDVAEKDLDMLSTLYDVEAVERSMYSKTQSKMPTQEAELTALPTEEDDGVEKRGDPKASLDINMLMILESLHRGLTLYAWFSMRFPVAFCHALHVDQLRKRAEHAIDYCLEAIRSNRQIRLAAMGRSPEQEKGRHSSGYERRTGTQSRFRRG